MTITEPGIYPDIPPETYHGGIFPNSVSYSTLKLLLDEAGPAKYRHALDSPRVEKKAFDLGTALHAELLGKGRERLEIIDAADYRTKAAREARDAAYAAGKTPLLPKDVQLLDEAAEGIPDHIKAVFQDGQAEVAMLYQHPAGINVRGQIDFLRTDAIVDLKTIQATDTRTIERQIWDYRYYLQAATYQLLHEELTGESLPYFIIAVELKPPYLARTITLSEEYMELGREHLAKAIDLYQTCAREDHWPGHPPTPTVIDPPIWAYDDELEGVELKL